MMKPNAKTKLFLMLIAFLASFVLKNHSEMVDTVYGHDGTAESPASPAAARASLGGPVGGIGFTEEETRGAIFAEAYRFFEAKKRLDEVLSDHRKQRDSKTELEKYEFIMDRQPELIEQMEDFSQPYHYLPQDVKKSLSDDIAKLEEEGSEELYNIVKKLSSENAKLTEQINAAVTPSPHCPTGAAKSGDEEAVNAIKKEEREAKRMRRTLYGRVWSDFSKFLKDYDLSDPSTYEEVKEEMDENIKEEVADFLEEEFDELDGAALLKFDLSETKIPRELKSLDRTIRELKKKGRRLDRKSVGNPEEQAQKERALTSLAIQLYAAKKMKSRIESQVEKRFRAIRDSLVAVQTQADNIKAQEERMAAMAKMFESSDPMTKMLLLEMFGDPLAGGASAAAPQGFSLDIGSSPGGGLRVGLGAQGAESGFAFDFSQQPKDPFSGLFPGYNNGGSNPYGGFNPAFDPRRFGGSYWGGF